MRAALAIGLLIASLWGAACGGDDDSTTRPETDAEKTAPAEPKRGGEADAGDRGGGDRGGPRALTVEQVTELVLTSDNPEDACLPPHVTERYVDSAYGGAAGCLEAIRSGGVIAKSVRIESLDESQNTAAVTAIAKGGPYDGEPIDVELLRNGPNWSVDAVVVDVPPGP